jgi:hypothetical protein
MTTEGGQAEVNRRVQQDELFGELGAVLERLWMFYEAMRFGKPVEDADAALAQLGNGLRHSVKRLNRSGNLSAPPAADQRDAEAC